MPELHRVRPLRHGEKGQAPYTSADHRRQSPPGATASPGREPASRRRLASPKPCCSPGRARPRRRRSPRQDRAGNRMRSREMRSNRSAERPSQFVCAQKGRLVVCRMPPPMPLRRAGPAQADRRLPRGEGAEDSVTTRSRWMAGRPIPAPSTRTRVMGFHPRKGEQCTCTPARMLGFNQLPQGYH